MEEVQDFDDIRSLYDEEVDETVAFLAQDPEFIRVVLSVLPDMSLAELKAQLFACHTKGDVLQRLSYPALKSLLQRSTTSVGFAGEEKAKGSGAFTAISNHRDIVLDAALLNMLLYEAGLGWVEIAIGDNLLIHPWIEKLVRLSGCFIVKRGVSMKSQLEISKQLSAYIRHNITDLQKSVWIAQREGRAKDSNDRTQESILKMFALGSDKELIDALTELNIIPITLSYEYDPCDFLKAKEFQLRRDDPEYKKSPEDDLQSMEIGILGFKGRIVFTMGNPINQTLPAIKEQIAEKADQVTAISELIDREIHLNYHFFPVNYIAYDACTGENRFSAHYTAAQKQEIEAYFQKQVDKIELENKDEAFLLDRLHEMYAYPLSNYLDAKYLS